MTQKAGPKPAPPNPPDDAPKAPPWWRTLRADAPALPRIVLSLAMVGLILLLWSTSSKLPGPSKVFGSYQQYEGRDEAGNPKYKTTQTIDSLVHRDLRSNLEKTLWRVFQGVFWAAIFGVSLGVLASAFRGVAAMLNPLVVFLRSVPMGALLPLVLALATGERVKVLFIFLAIVGFVFSDAYKAVSAVPQRYVETAETLGASRFQIITKVLVPLALPDIVTSLRFQFGLAFGYIMLVEAVEDTGGIGAMLNKGIVGPEQKFLLLVVIALLAFLIDFVLREAQRFAFSYRQDL
jgi:ABC-type nitrate/sulfonate/bicarbonate transport system permease component